MPSWDWFFATVYAAFHWPFSGPQSSCRRYAHLPKLSSLCFSGSFSPRSLYLSLWSPVAPRPHTQLRHPTTRPPPNPSPCLSLPLPPTSVPALLTSSLLPYSAPRILRSLGPSTLSRVATPPSAPSIPPATTPPPSLSPPPIPSPSPPPAQPMLPNPQRPPSPFSIPLPFSQVFPPPLPISETIPSLSQARTSSTAQKFWFPATLFLPPLFLRPNSQLQAAPPAPAPSPSLLKIRILAAPPLLLSIFRSTVQPSPPVVRRCLPVKAPA